MPRRNSPNTIQSLGDLSQLAEIVVDKRRGQRASAKKNRRNRHYEKQFIRNTLAHLPRGAAAADSLADGLELTGLTELTEVPDTERPEPEPPAAAHPGLPR